MKTTKLIAPLAAVLFLSLTAFAGTTGTNTVTNVWDYGNDPLEEVLEMEAIPAIRTTTFSKLSFDVEPAFDNYIVIKDLPFGEEENIGVTVYDEKGKMVFSKFDTYKNLQRFLVNDFGDNQYEVKVYKDNTVYEAKFLVAYR